MSQLMSKCEQCQEQYTLFRRKKECDLCGQTFCSKCVPRQSCFLLFNSSRACAICSIITNSRTTRHELSLIRVKHLRAYLLHSKIISLNHLESYFEKEDLINLILSKKNQTSNNIATTSNNINYQENHQTLTNTNEEVLASNFDSSISINESRQQSLGDRATLKTGSNRVTLDDVSSLESIYDLTVRQLKDILTQNFIATTGCVEKTDLIKKVELLYRNKKEQKNTNSNMTSDQSNENLCKICMDADIECVFLDCGHICTCLRCGKQLSECPLCRSYIIRVVRVFKS